MSSREGRKDRYDFSANDSFLECALNHIDESLDYLVQAFVRRDEEYEHLGQRSYYESIFQVYLKGSNFPGNARHLPSEKKALIWDEVFRLKNMFLGHQQPDVVIHRIKYPFPFEKRRDLYRERLNLHEYDFSADGTLVWLERKIAV